MQLERFGRTFIGVLVALALLALASTGGQAAGNGRKGSQEDREDRMSAMGRSAGRARAAVEAGADAARVAALARGLPAGIPRDCVNEPDCEENGEQGPAGGQAEVSIAVDATGQHVVIGYNDTRGFALNPVSVSGVRYSDDGGQTFVDGGQLPSPGIDTIGATKLPQVFGDPDVKYLGDCTFIYASILVNKFSATRAVQTLGVHRSTDCGHTWAGPFTITAATNPNGAVTSSGTPRDAADKEFLDVDRDTGRVIVSWSNFTPFAAGGVEISTSYSDNIRAATPTWTSHKVVANGPSDGQSSIPRFASGSSDAYIAWRRFPSFYGNVIGFARSADNGATWSAPIELSAEFFTMDQVLGNDRVNTSPSLAVDNSPGINRGNAYVVYSDNDNQDGADVVLQRSTDGGTSFSLPLLLNSRPGADRAQWFPWVTVDNDTGRVYVFYYDQGIATDGDLTETTYTYSDDAGLSWVAPRPLTERPFHAAWGNDTGQPNLGDYSQAVAQGGELFSAFAFTARPPGGFADGQPTSASFTVPDVYFKRLAPSRSRDEDEDEGDEVKRERKVMTLAIGGVSFAEGGGKKHPAPNGYIDPGDRVNLRIALTNYVTNPLNAHRQDAEATLFTDTPGVRVRRHNAHYSRLDPGQTKGNREGFDLEFAPSFVAGTAVDLRLELKGEEGQRSMLLYRLPTGTPVPATLFAENFDGVASGAVPAGWIRAHGGGSNTVPWTTSSSFCSATSNAAFHVNANDGANPTRFERLFSPLFTVPADAEYVTLDFDVCYNTEEDPNFNILAYDGFLVRVTDNTSGRILRSVLIDAFADELTTGSANGYPRHFPRSSSSAYFEDMSAWAGYSNGWKHVRARLPGTAGSTLQLRFEYTQDGAGICSDIRPGNSCGVAVDNLVVQSVVSKTP